MEDQVTTSPNVFTACVADGHNRDERHDSRRQCSSLHPRYSLAEILNKILDISKESCYLIVSAHFRQ